LNTKLNLVLDIAGVIATNFSPMLWKDLSSRFGVAYDDLIKFRQENRGDLWTGKIEEQEFCGMDKLFKCLSNAAIGAHCTTF